MNIEMLLNGTTTLESIEDELEFVFFMKLSNLKELDGASKVERMKQAEYFLTEENSKKRTGLMRTREVGLGSEIGNDSNPISLTIKIFNEEGGNRGSVCSINRDVQEAFALVADRNIDKTRYYFDIPDSELVWEIDLPIGSADGWVKVDLEVDSVDTKLPDFPLSVEHVIDVSFGKKVSDKDSKTLDLIFKQFNGK
jgi:hypothetical protein